MDFKKQLNIGAFEFVFMMAAFMSLHAFTMDAMLPALPNISNYLSMSHRNDLQFIVTVYLLGFGAAQVFYGLFSDRFGRKKLIILALIIYIFSSLFTLFAQNQLEFLLGRFIQGISCAGTVVISISIIRDIYSGRAMSRIMSLVMMIFMLFPVLAPSVGLSIVLIYDWHGIFIFLTCLGILILFWSLLRLPETLPKNKRRPLNCTASIKTIQEIFRSRIFLGYMIAQTFALANIFSFLTLSEQIFIQVFNIGDIYPIILAVIALASVCTSLLNSLLVVTFGMRRLSHSAIIIFMLLSAILLYLTANNMAEFWPFVVISTLIMASFGFMGANFNAIALEPFGHIAGTASSIIGTFSTLGGTLMSWFVGQFFNGSTLSLAIGLTAFGVGAFIATLYAEHGVILKENKR
ncbi:multidrug effflux MFS transporter [Shewanella surugensis]|uniref:Bcr/CflA family efflux transporter n=1 Tax=Shewanella surugensis TaxID=212020 RepID=A0ABT0LHR7_9GAMM|nr:multidrug effflux MFS transporter [Shewanella surugensis]MCL1127005.1 multidrug effflux MFS transporter [Shewanella surugensis]